jgi:hypothetical protein
MTTNENGKPKRKLKKWQIVGIVIFVLFIIGSLSGGGSSTETPTTNTPTPANTESNKPKVSSETVSQANAAKKAENYLSIMAFSQSGLINQLKFDGFSTSDATYGVIAQNANWNDQAAKKAENYLSIMAFSRSGLINQLKFDGFSQEQAAYGATANGL